MIFLTEQDIIERIKNPKNRELVKRGKELLKSHQLHVHGVGVDDFLSKVENYENDAQLINRKKTTKPATVPIFGKELSTFNKVFSAQGFSRYYDISNESIGLENDFKNYLKNIGEGLSMSEIMEEIWLDKVNYDPNGVFMVELPEEPTAKPEPYVTFRSICDIHDIDYEGKEIEYIIFVESKLDNDGQYFEYRIIDNNYDYIAIERDNKIEIQKDKTLKNIWGYVPATFISNQRDSCSKAKTSFIWRAIGIADEYLTDSSLHSVLKKLHFYPIFWMRERGCKDCSGEGNRTIDGELFPCTSCKGSGYSLKKDVSDGVIIPQLTEAGQQDSLPVAGYVQPDISTLAEQRAEMDWLKSFIHCGIWADEENYQTQNSSEKTATGEIMDVQTIHDKLLMVTKCAEGVELFLTNCIGQARYGSAYNGASINYGRRYFVRSAFEIEQMYEAAKKAELPNSILSAYREELLYVKFGNDQVQLNRQLKLMELEPLPDYTLQQLKDIEADKSDIFMKIYFVDYIERYEREVKPIAMASIEEIRLKLEQYNSEKINKQPQQVAQIQAA